MKFLNWFKDPLNMLGVALLMVAISFSAFMIKETASEKKECYPVGEYDVKEEHHNRTCLYWINDMGQTVHKVCNFDEQIKGY